MLRSLRRASRLSDRVLHFADFSSCSSSAYNVVKLWNMDDLSEPFSKFRNTCTSASLVLVPCCADPVPPSRRTDIVEGLVDDVPRLPPAPHDARLRLERRLATRIVNRARRAHQPLSHARLLQDAQLGLDDAVILGLLLALSYPFASSCCPLSHPEVTVEPTTRFAASSLYLHNHLCPLAEPDEVSGSTRIHSTSLMLLVAAPPLPPSPAS